MEEFKKIILEMYNNEEIDKVAANEIIKFAYFEGFNNVDLETYTGLIERTNKLPRLKIFFLLVNISINYFNNYMIAEDKIFEVDEMINYYKSFLKSLTDEQKLIFDNSSRLFLDWLLNKG